MSYLRFTLDMAIKQPIPSALEDKLPAIRDAVRQLKTYTVKINEGLPNEEQTTKAVFHICRHDEDAPCESEQEI